MAEWIKLNDNEKLAIYFDPATVRKSGGMRKLWLLIDFKNAKEDIPNKTYNSMKVRSEVDCTSERTRSLYVLNISGNMGAGDVVAVVRKPTQWLLVVPDSLSMTLWRGSCGETQNENTITNRVTDK